MYAPTTSGSDASMAFADARRGPLRAYGRGTPATAAQPANSTSRDAAESPAALRPDPPLHAPSGVAPFDVRGGDGMKRLTSYPSGTTCSDSGRNDRM